MIVFILSYQAEIVYVFFITKLTVGTNYAIIDLGSLQQNMENLQGEYLNFITSSIYNHHKVLSRMTLFL